MGADLLVDPEIADLCDKCASAAGVDLRHLLTSADDEELRLGHGLVGAPAKGIRLSREFE